MPWAGGLQGTLGASATQAGGAEEPGAGPLSGFCGSLRPSP